MSSPSSPGGNPFENMLGDLLRVLGQAGNVQWELARQMASSAVTDGDPEPNVDPLERIRLEELLKVAELHVGETTGMRTSEGVAPVSVRPVRRIDWALASLDSWKPLLEPLTRAPVAGEQAEDDESANRLTGLLASLGRMVGPAMSGLLLGSSVGHLARRALGQYDFPIPRSANDELMVVPANVAAFASDWSLPHDDVRLWICTSEVAHHAVLIRPEIRRRMEELLTSYVTGYQQHFDPSALEDSLTGVDLNDLSSLDQVLSEGAVGQSSEDTPAQAETRAALEALVEALEGYVDWVTETVGRRLMPSQRALSEALRRRRVERPSGERFVERTFGLKLGQEQFDRGSAFVAGVIERAGEGALGRLWESARNIPTPSEIVAPGLWLERIELPS
jgi:putative hydrolase